MLKPLHSRLSPLDELLLSAGKTHASIKSRLGTFLFSGIFFLAGCAILYAATLYPIAKYYESRNWQQTNAIITESKLDWEDDSARIQIHYKYRISGTPYTGDRFGWDSSRKNFAIEEKRKTVRRYKKGKPITIWFDPENPSQSIINRDKTGISGMTLFFPVPFILIGICGLSYSFFGGRAAARTQKLFEKLATEADSKGITSLANQLRHPPTAKDHSRKIVFSMAQSKIEGLTLLFATIFWNGIVAVFLSLLVVFILSSDSTALFLGPFLIPFVLIGIFLIRCTLRKLREPRPPAFAIAFSGLNLTTEEIEIPISWMNLASFTPSPDAANITLSISRNHTSHPLSFRKAKTLTTPQAIDPLPLNQQANQTIIRLPKTPQDPKKPAWKTTPLQEITATLTWEEQPRRTEKSTTWILITPESND